MSDTMIMSVSGIDEIKDLLSNLSPRIADNLMTATIRGVAGEAVKQIKINGGPVKRTGNLLKSLKIKKVRSDRTNPTFNVIFNSGSDSRYDGFYWRFVEHGTKFSQGSDFVRNAKYKVISELDFHIATQFTKKFNARINRERRRIQRLNNS